MSPWPQVLVTRNTIAPSALALLREQCEVDFHDDREAMSRTELLSRVRGKQGLVTMITDVIDREVLEAADSLRVVANVAVGFNNIDVSTARQRDIIVTNTPDVLTDAVADFTFALILGITRRIPECDRYVRAGRWKAFGLDLLPGRELRGKQLGIVGFGRIGAAVATRARAFGMRVSFTRRGPGEDVLGQRMPLDTLLASSDVVSVHVPLSAETRHLIDAAAIRRMKPGAYLVNTSRGPVVDEVALTDALVTGRLAGAALDVFENEPRIEPRLLELENVILTPHVGSGTMEARTAMAELAVRNVLAVLAGSQPLTPIDGGEAWVRRK
jgi:glyoxylate reductase